MPSMLRLLLRRPRFARLWAAGAVSLVGDWLSFVAVSLLAVDRGGGAVAVAMVQAAHALPGAFVSPIAGVLADRFDRRTLMITAALAQAALTAAMAAAAAAGNVALVQLLLVTRSALAAFVPPAEAAALRNVVDEDELLEANALVASTWSVAFVGGMALGGALAMLGPAVAIALDAGSFLVAASLLATLPRMPPAGARPTPVLAVLRAIPRDLADAGRRALAHPPLLRAVLGKSPLALASGASWLALNLVAATERPFGSAAISLGVLQATRGAGTGIGPVVASILVKRGLRAEVASIAAYVVGLGGMTAFVLVHGAAPLFVAALAWGIGSGSNWVLTSSAVQRLGGESHVGRLTSVDELSVSVCVVGSALAAAAWIDGGAAIAVPTLAWIAVGAASWVALALATATRREARAGS